jgi:hypothetical protein
MQTVLIFVNADGDKTAGVAFIENYILTDYILTKLDEQTKELNETIGSFVKTVSDLNNENDSLKSKGALWKNIALAFIPFSGGTVIILAAVLIHIRHQRGQIARHIESAGLQSISMEEPEIETGNKLLSPIQGNA